MFSTLKNITTENFSKSLTRMQYIVIIRASVTKETINDAFSVTVGAKTDLDSFMWKWASLCLVLQIKTRLHLVIMTDHLLLRSQGQDQFIFKPKT